MRFIPRSCLSLHLLFCFQQLKGVSLHVNIIVQEGKQKQVIGYIIIMGCISQNGCLGPRRREKEVYTELIEQIYSEAQRIDDFNGGDTFTAIRMRTTKKGTLRKLIDHLLSHKNKINECLNYNLRLATQSRSADRKMAGLLVIDEITTKVYKVAKVEQNEEGPTISKSASSHNRQLLEGHEMKVGADLRFDLAYFRLILHLLQSEKEMTDIVLDSILNFCVGRKERFGCKAEVWRVLELLLQHLQSGEMKERAARCYLNLLELLKEGGKEENSHEGDLLVFFRLWQKEEEVEPDSAHQEDFHHTVFRIIKLFVNRCMSSWDSKVLFRALFQVYEDDRFAVSKLVKLQGMVIGIILQHDLHAHILRGLFLYLLQFISAVPQERASFRSSFNEQFQLQRYPHVYDRGIRLRLFQTLRRWGEQGYINLDESVTFSSSSLVAAYTSNFKGEREYVQEIVREFFKLTDLLSPKSNLTVVNLLLDEIRWVKTDEGVRRLLINLTREVLELRKLLQLPIVECCNLFVPIDASFSRDTRVELIQLMGFVVRNLSLQQLINSDDEEGSTTQTICQLFYSLFEGSKTLFQPSKQKPREQQEILPRYQYANALLSFLKCFIQKSAYLYSLCFLAALTDKLGADTSRFGLYFQLYFIYEGLHLINHKNKLPDRMMSINFKISPSAKVADLAQEIDSFIGQWAGAKGEMLPKVRREMLGQLKNLQEFTMLSEVEYRQMQQSFQCYFKPIARKQSQLLSFSKGDQSRTQFKRESVNNSFYESCHESKDEDNSFKDVVDRIIEI